MNIKGIIFILLGVILVAGLFYVLKPETEVPNTDNTQAEIVVEDTNKVFNLVLEKGKIVNGESVLKVTEGDSVTISIVSDTSEEVHFHGYDKMLIVEKNIKNEITFIANLTGRFEFEFEKSGTVLGYLEVLPK